ncbi:NAD(P)H-binding protein [Microcoleus sp. bin38.metabat.b11b12b14.051]|uniref:NmrA family NAD(P)-binding protein n=1 Tax=Microcoleus sp. bin38.metabat.b11b12b14.051 TaxID=2742709 RepID=UPI0025CD2EC1|nr:NAD(P)H-binding protein [Microcoleus sp. bin38.metabat.b11b12b14.051]
MKIVIAAASGNIGRRTAEKVIQAGSETVLLARHSEKLADLVAKGATVKPIGSDDTEGLIEATQNADALFWLTPPKLDVPSLYDWYIQTAMAGARAVQENRIKRVVNISSIGAGAKPNLGAVSFCGDVEALFNQTDANLLHLRPGYFMENFLAGQVEFIRRDRTVNFSFPSDRDIPWISTDDIGDVAAKYLIDDAWSGQWTRNLMGPENLTVSKIIEILSKMRGHPIEYVQVTIESFQQSLALMGATPDIQREIGNMYLNFGDYDGVYATARTPEAVTPTTFEEFAKNKLFPKI